ncbi:MAG: mechanosensitive ion channel domain-containing protein [Bdellovibrionales bacterium]
MKSLCGNLLFLLVVLAAFSNGNGYKYSLAHAQEQTHEHSPEPGVVESPASEGHTDVQDRPTYPVVYREQVAFVLSESAGGQDAATRARQASQALKVALESQGQNTAVSGTETGAKEGKTGPEPLLKVDKGQSKATLRVGEQVVLSLYAADAEAAGFVSLDDYVDHIRGLLQDFIARQQQKAWIQQTFLSVFMSIFFILLGFVLLVRLHRALNQADHILDEKKGTLRPLSIMGEPVLGGEAVGGLLAVALVVGRVLMYALTVAAVIFAILGQFDRTRDLLTSTLRTTLARALGGVESLVAAIPGLILAVFLSVVLWTALKALDLFLKGVSSGRIQLGFLPIRRVPVVRVFGSVALIILIAPLAITAAFGSVHTPLESIVVVMAGALFLGAVPVIASVVVGATVLWRTDLRPGDWISIGDITGEITSISLNEIRLVPLSGGKISIPYIKLLTQPLRVLSHAPSFLLDIVLEKRGLSLEQMTEDLSELFSADESPHVEIVDLRPDRIRVEIRFLAVRNNAGDSAMRKIAHAMEAGDFAVISCELKRGLTL